MKRSRDAVLVTVLDAASALVDSAGLSPWNTIAYEVTLASRGVSLTRQDFADCVANFERYGGAVPVVLYHADLDPSAHPESRKAHARIEALRVGTFRRPSGEMVASLDARLRWIVDATRVDVESGAINRCSITIVQHGVDEETGEGIGAFLISLSLTNNPALVDLPALAAERRPMTDPIRRPRRTEAGYFYGDLDDRDDALSMLRAVFELPALATEADCLAALDRFEGLLVAPDPEPGVDLDHLLTCLREALRLPALATAAEVVAACRAALSLPSDDTSPTPGGDPATNQEMPTMSQNVDAELATEARATRATLGADSPAAVTRRLAELSSQAAEVPALRARIATLEAAETARAAEARSAHLRDLFARRPELEPARGALEAYAAADFQAFSVAYPVPTAATPAALTRRVVPGDATPPVAAPTGSAPSMMDTADELARDLMARTPGLTYRDALLAAGRQVQTVARTTANGRV